MLRALSLPLDADSVDVRAVHASHADFVWMRLQRLGVRAADLEDVFQEVFVVVHRRLHTFDNRVPITRWLVGICVKVAAAHRRRAHLRREQLVESFPEEPSPGCGPDEELSRRERERQLRQALERLDTEKRVVFVMFELDEMSCDEIASALGVPVGTVHSRLFTARKLFHKAMRAIGHLRGDEEGHT